MQRGGLASVLTIGLLLAGCGSHPAVLSSGTPAPVRVNQAATAAGLSVSQILMPPLEVFKTVDENKAQFVKSLKAHNDVKRITFSPVVQTLRFNVNGDKAGYMVTVGATSVIRKVESPEIKEVNEAYLITYTVDAAGKLACTSTLQAQSASDKKQPKPTVTMSKTAGTFQLRMLQGNVLPPQIAATLADLHPDQAETLKARYDGLKVFPDDIGWAKDLGCEIWHKDQLVGYLDDPATWAFQMDGQKWANRFGMMVFNVLSPAGDKAYSTGYAISPQNPLGFVTFPI